MFIPTEPNRISIQQSLLLLVGAFCGILACIPIAFFLALWFFVTIFISDSLDFDILETLNNGSPFMLGSKIGFAIATLVFSAYNILWVAPLLIFLVLFNIVLTKRYA
jgi:hypothetical protein